ncbi:MAG: PEP-CTERM sorting domain-containing protein [Fimbriimonadaceae bacterium]
MSKRACFTGLSLAFASVSIASPFATEVVSSTGLPGDGLYNDPNSVLGKPTTLFNSGSASNPDIRRTKLAEGLFNTDPEGGKLITTIGEGQSVTVKFAQPVVDDPNNWYGLDFIVFGNAFFSAEGVVDDDTNANTMKLGQSGAAFTEPVKVSVSQDNVNWYTFDDGPYADTLFPTNAYRWDRDAAAWTDQELDWTKPVDPSLTNADFGGITIADALDLYDGSAGGTGFDLAESGFASIQYIRVEGVSGFAGGEIDAFADVAPVPEPATLAALGLGLAALARRRGGKR